MLKKDVKHVALVSILGLIGGFAGAVAYDAFFVPSDLKFCFAEKDRPQVVKIKLNDYMRSYEKRLSPDKNGVVLFEKIPKGEYTVVKEINGVDYQDKIEIPGGAVYVGIGCSD